MGKRPWMEPLGASGNGTGFSFGSEVHAGLNVDQPDLMVCDPAPATPMLSASNCTAETELEGLKRMDAAARCEVGVALLPSNLNHVDDKSPFTNFLLYQQSVLAERDQKTMQSYPTFTAIDLVRFLEDRSTKIAEAALQNRADSDAIHQLQMVEMSSKYQQQATEIESRLEGNVQELVCSKERVSKHLTDVEAQLGILKAAEAEVKVHNSTLLKTNGELNKEKGECKALLEKRDSELKAANAKIVGHEAILRRSMEAEQAKRKEVLNLKSVILEREKAGQEMQSANTQLTSDFQKLKEKITEIEKKSAQESLTSGSYAEGHANPAMMVSACQNIDTATDKLARYAHENSIWNGLPLKSPKIERLISSMSRARPGDFFRPAHVRHVWAHWMCSKMYQGFENVFFDVGEERKSPVDSKSHATECFGRFQKLQGTSSTDIHEGCKFFQKYCSKMYQLVFPSDLVMEGIVWSESMILEKSGRFDGDGELYALFLDVAKAIWMLHQLAFSFDPPASILRMSWGESFDRQFHDSMIKDADSDVMSSKVVLMTRPAFRIKNTTAMKSRVLLSKTL